MPHSYRCYYDTTAAIFPQLYFNLIINKKKHSFVSFAKNNLFPIKKQETLDFFKIWTIILAIIAL